MEHPFEIETGFLKGHGVVESPAIANRMLERHRRIVGMNRGAFKGKTVLDLASHNGRWSYAALKAGAKYVLGIEGRQELIDRGLDDFKRFPPDRYDFVCADVFSLDSVVRERNITAFDTVLCLGLFYHVADHYRLIRLMRALNPSTIIIDSPFILKEDIFVRYRTERASDLSNALPEHAAVKDAISGVPSLGMLQLMAHVSGYGVRFVPWHRKEVKSRDGIEDYFSSDKHGSQRCTVVLEALPNKPIWQFER